VNSKLKTLVIQIDTYRRLVAIALESGDNDLLWRTQRLLTITQAEYFDVTTKILGLRARDTLLVFSEQFQDGAVMDQATYKILLSCMDHFDRETHQAIPVDAEMSELVENTVFELFASKRGA
jgi:hypothetical protein